MNPFFPFFFIIKTGGFMTQKFIDRDGLKVLWKQASLQDYPNNETLMAVIDAIDETKANKDELSGTVEITSGNPEKENTVLIVNPETKEEIDIYSVEEINEKLNQLKNAGLSEELKTVLITYFTNMQTLLSQLVYISEENIGNTLTNNLTNLIIALGGKICTGISVSYIGGDVPVGTSLSSLSGITVTAYYSDDSTSDISDYVLSGAIAEGENTIIVSYGIHNTSFTVIGKNILTYEPAISTFTAELTSNEDNTYNMNFTASENKYYAALLKYNGEYINELTISHSDLVSSAGNDDGSGDELDLIIIGYNENADYPYYAIFLDATEISGWRFYWNSNAEFIADDQRDLNPAPFSSTDLERVKLIVTTSDDDMVVTVTNANTNETIATKTILGLAADGYIPAIGIGGQSVPNTYSNIL